MVSGEEHATGLERVIKELGLKISELQKEQFLLYIELLMEGLEKQRLMGDRRGLTLVGKHLFDSLYPLKIWQKPEGSLLDLGTGAGMPGIPLKIYLPERTLYLMDSNRRKIAFLRRVGAELKLKMFIICRGGQRNGAATPAVESNSIVWSAGRWQRLRCW